MDNSPVTRAELDAAIAPLATKAQLEDLRIDLRNDLQTGLRELREFVVEAIHDAQTELLRGFEFYAKTNDARLRRMEIHATAHDSYEAAMNERMLSVEARIVEIEKKLLKP